MLDGINILEKKISWASRTYVQRHWHWLQHRRQRPATYRAVVMSMGIMWCGLLQPWPHSQTPGACGPSRLTSVRSKHLQLWHVQMQKLWLCQIQKLWIRYSLRLIWVFGMSRNSLESQAVTLRLRKGMKHSQVVTVHLSLGFFNTPRGKLGWELCQIWPYIRHRCLLGYRKGCNRNVQECTFTGRKEEKIFTSFWVC